MNVERDDEGRAYVDMPNGRRTYVVGDAVDGEAEELDHAVIRRIADVQAERVSWLWPARIPLGKLTVLDGDPGLGKSTLTLELAARVSTGRPMPAESHPSIEPAGVVLLSAEDGLADTIRPRLGAANADLDRVVVLEAVQSSDGFPRPPELPRDLDFVLEAVLDVRAALLVVDPLMAFLGGQVNSYRDQDVRRALHPLAKLADHTGVAVVVVRHLSKSGGGHPIYRGGGSIGIIGAARSGLLVAPDPKDDDRRVLAVTKANLAAPATSLAYRLVADGSGCVRVAWEGATEHRAADLLALPTDDDERSSQDEAVEFLHELLSEGRVMAKEAKRLGRQAGIADRTLDRARKRAGVRTWRDGFGQGATYWWELPAGHPRLVDPHVRLARRTSGNGAHGSHGGEDDAAGLVLDAFEGAEVVA